MLLRTSVAAFAATISLGLWSEACADREWPATELNVPPTASTDNYWQKDVTVVAITPDGTWGVATELTTGQAIANAIADCKNKYKSKIGCGSMITSVRGGWSIGKRCGNQSIFVAEQSLAKAAGSRSTARFEVRVIYEKKVDASVERDRLQKELERMDREIGNAQRQLGNEGFLQKAPPKVVEGLRKRAQELEVLREKAQGALNELQ